MDEIQNDKTAQNTDLKLWCECGDNGDSIYVMEGGAIGIVVGGYAIVLPLGTWHALARQNEPPRKPRPSDPTP